VTVPKPAPFPGCGELRSKAIAFVFQLGYRGYGVAHRKLEVILRALAAGGVSDVLPRGFRRRVFHVHHAESVVEIRQFQGGTGFLAPDLSKLGLACGQRPRPRQPDLGRPVDAHIEAF